MLYSIVCGVSLSDLVEKGVFCLGLFTVLCVFGGPVSTCGLSAWTLCHLFTVSPWSFTLCCFIFTCLTLSGQRRLEERLFGSAGELSVSAKKRDEKSRATLGRGSAPTEAVRNARLLEGAGSGTRTSSCCQGGIACVACLLCLCF